MGITAKEETSGTRVQRIFPYPAEEVLEALRQTIQYSASFDLLGQQQDRTILFRISNAETVFSARVEAMNPDRTMVELAAPVETADFTGTCEQLYHRLADQAAGLHSVRNPELLRKHLRQQRIQGFLFADNDGPINELVWWALGVNAFTLLMGVALIFDDERPEASELWGMLAMLIAIMWGVSGAAFIRTGRHMKQSGRVYAVLSCVLSIVLTLLLILLARHVT